ncbi:glycerol-3-phosphate dehydrogenase [Agrilactobacillus composti DSM 18527 = JCM 14202]|uniref:Glycerol-3-phosphate dehydrogenase [NAD(P)+] n=1 Tax=Agrilactobacillus composti DSM 18527 = JCM 14202 TaxID=1423734 RepID=X0PT15_9LACO|nr:NAD(P)H-dependent glycerol-3-phosphate dehydrogenase [Agrilactobacillus composti]KRM31163.1 glycerol-3-phosphate dehydrogenase [Agrilactobacillus composti DSM 18527 = JCM 14202]GAF41097.1 glycerol-3-phosphate dehydrogenase [Agrilactobacillus composti DSM 18527 = JCM 14202]
MTKITVLGSGSWGTVLANLLVENGHHVLLWGRGEKEVQEINTQHTNRHYLPESTLRPQLKATTDLQAAIAGTDAILFVVPTKAIRSVAQQVAQQLTKVPELKPIIITATKGLEQHTNARISEIISHEIAANLRQGVVVLSGPSHAEEVIKDDITTLTVASKDVPSANWVQKIFMNDHFRLYTNNDVTGVEVGAALKNVIAIGAGIVHGLDYGDNAKAALMTRGLAEMTRMGVSLGADPLTFSGLSGLGDLIVTCTSVHSRNWRAGNALGQGRKLPEILADMGMAVEGVYTAKTAHDLSIAQNIDMPISESIYKVLYEDADLKTEVINIMKRKGQSENELMRPRLSGESE